MGQKFGAAQVDFEHLPEAERMPVGIAWLDNELGGGMTRGSLCEISSTAGYSAGGAVFLVKLLQNAARNRQRIVLIDAADSFDPCSVGETLCRSLLWARCRNVEETIRVADLILRDGNLPLVVLDLQWCPAKDIQRVPSSSWHRLRGVIEESGVMCMMLTPFPIITSAAGRFELNSQFTLADCERPEGEWEGKLQGLRRSVNQQADEQKRSGVA